MPSPDSKVRFIISRRDSTTSEDSCFEKFDVSEIAFSKLAFVTAIIVTSIQNALRTVFYGNTD